MSPATQQALSALRDPAQLDWQVIPALSLVAFIYAARVERGLWDQVATALTFYGAEWLWEIFNALLVPLTGWAPLWSTPGRTWLVLLVGLNLEITLMFAVAPLVLLMLLPEDRAHRVLGLPTRWLAPCGFAAFCVLVECLLNRAGLLIWDWWFWRFPHVYLILLAYGLPMLGLVWFHDRVPLRLKAYCALATCAAAALAFLVLGPLLTWV